VKRTGALFDCRRFRLLEFRVGHQQVIEALDIAVRHICTGSRARLHVPAQFAYGKAGVSKLVPPNSSVVLDVELVFLNGVSASDGLCAGCSCSIM
jgi:FK506-binding protein 2